MKLIRQYFPHISEEQIYKLKSFHKYSSEWNNKINLISRKDIDFFEERHLLHSLSVAGIFNFTAKTSIIDVGTGGGFPGIPLAIFFPEVEFTLVDSIRKKIIAVDDIINKLNLINCKTLNCRIEQINKKYDFVIARAVTSFPAFFTLTKNLIAKNSKNQFSNGIIYLKGGDFNEEIESFKNIVVFDLDKTYKTDFFSTKKIIYLPFNN
ncbi:MAG: 16S rRNA (guanine(527)-N(7))-methyltransferase RsmG [Bacteroidota bacterium]